MGKKKNSNNLCFDTQENIIVIHGGDGCDGSGGGDGDGGVFIRTVRLIAFHTCNKII